MFKVMFPPMFKAVSVPTPVRLEAVTPGASVAPVKAPASMVIVMGVEPSKDRPLIVVAAANLVAVEALPVKVPVTLPDKAPWKVVAEILVAPVIS